MRKRNETLTRQVKKVEAGLKPASTKTYPPKNLGGGLRWGKCLKHTIMSSWWFEVLIKKIFREGNTMNPLIFREYDIRGIAETELVDPVVESIGKAYGTIILRKGGRRVCVGRDVRLSSERIRDAVIRGILSTGCDVIDVGQVPTPTLYFSIVHLKTDGGVSVTGSHNPVEYNGLKLCQDGTEALYGAEIQKLMEMIEAGDFTSGNGSLSCENTVPSYIEAIKARITLARKVKVVVDAGNGTASEIGPKILHELGCDVVPLFCEIDGRFPNHLPDPIVPKYMKWLCEKVVESKADVGIGYDGDADRIGAVDDKGNLIWGDQLLAIYSRDLLSRKPGSKIIFDVKCSQGLVEEIKAHGGQPLMWKTGHSLIKTKMKEDNVPIAGEMSGHMFFAENYFGYDDAIYASALLLGILSRESQKFSEIVDSMPKYISTPEIRVGCSDQEKFAVVDSIREYFRVHNDIIDIDGVRILFGDGWGLIRPSNTQPVLVLRFEAKTDARLREIIDTVVQKLKEYPSVAVDDLKF